MEYFHLIVLYVVLLLSSIWVISLIIFLIYHIVNSQTTRKHDELHEILSQNDIAYKQA
jgi:hypothetical protein